MRALFWNIRGFGHDGRRRQLVEYIRDEHIDIIAIQETMRTDFCLPELDSLSSHLFAWHWLPSSGNNGHSGGILLGVKDTTTTREKASSSAGFRCISSAGTDATNKALQLTRSSSTCSPARLMEARYC